MKILVVGGSYFLGRWFVQHAYKRHEITVLNRGNIPIGLDNVTELVADRHNNDELCKLKALNFKYDAVVDFCAYYRNDIRQILENLGATPGRYIYLSTVDVYKKQSGCALDESSELVDADEVMTDTEQRTNDPVEKGSGSEAEYIRGKALLEHELITECDSRNIRGVSVRPAILYGPGNYAPRESIYLEWIRRAGQIIHPVDSDGYFQMLYVSDAAMGLLKLCEIPQDELKRAYNFCTEQILNYDDFERALAGAFSLFDPSGSDKQIFSKVDVTVDTVIERNIPLPFPLTGAGSCLYSGNLFKDLGIRITPLEEGLLACIRVS
ncbi:MAG: NAD-dependent epimerase/dehydratase family protein [Lachnospiraceae bacterium]|nr:NAD-dependent epimerase/dehydratase family protein [Lachnospiraceae bacterium]